MSIESTNNNERSDFRSKLSRFLKVGAVSATLALPTVTQAEQVSNAEIRTYTEALGGGQRSPEEVAQVIENIKGLQFYEVLQARSEVETKQEALALTFNSETETFSGVEIEVLRTALNNAISLGEAVLVKVESDPDMQTVIEYMEEGNVVNIMLPGDELEQAINRWQDDLSFLDQLTVNDSSD